MSKGREATVTVGEDRVTVRRKGRTEAVVAAALDIETDGEGRPVRVWCDRRIHRPEETELGEWHVEGAVVSVLTDISSLNPAF